MVDVHVQFLHREKHAAVEMHKSYFYLNVQFRMSIAGALGKSQIRKMLVKEFLENLSIFKSADRLNLT